MNTIAEVDHLATATGLVEAGVGISAMPGLTLSHFAREGLVFRPLNEPALTRRVYLAHRRDGSLSLAAQSMKALLLAHKPRVHVVSGTLKG
jgi:DNA-binding transcriptional LysR family regulator